MCSRHSSAVCSVERLTCAVLAVLQQVIARLFSCPVAYHLRHSTYYKGVTLESGQRTLHNLQLLLSILSRTSRFFNANVKLRNLSFTIIIYFRFCPSVKKFVICCPFILELITECDCKSARISVPFNNQIISSLLLSK